MRGTKPGRSCGIESLESRRLMAAVVSQSADLAGFSQGLNYTFDSPMSNADVLNALNLWGQNGLIPKQSLLVTATGANQVRVTWPGENGLGAGAGILRNGNFEAILEDGAGSPFTSRSVLPFFFLLGDTDFDRSVGFTDLVAVAQNYGKSGQTYAQGNLDYKGTVAFDADLIIVAKNYDTKLAPLPAPNTLTVGSTTSTAVTLNFTAPTDPDPVVASTQFTHVRILRSTDGVNYSAVANVPRSGAASYAWTDPSGLSPGTTYSYLVQPYHDNGNGSFTNWRLSNEVSATTSAAGGVIAPMDAIAPEKASAGSFRASRAERRRVDDVVTLHALDL